MKTTRETVAELVAAGGAEDEPADEGPGEGGEGGGLDDGEGGEDAPIESAEQQQEAKGEAPKGPTRGPDGKFVRPDAKAVPQPPEPPDRKIAGLASLPVTPVASALPELKPPADWSPRAKEKWAQVPREAQEEAHRLHTEVKKVLQDAATHRQAADAFQRTIAPYEHMFRAAGKSPVEGVGWLVQQYAALQTAPMPQRTAIVAGLIRDFLGVDEASIRALADHLEGKGGSAPAAAPALRPEQIRQMVQEEAQRMTGESARQAELKAIQDFEASGAEFLPNLTKEITAIVTLEKQQGKPITPELMKQAYERALRLNPETAAILKQRDDAAAAASKAAADKKKQAAATGIKNEPAGPGAPAKALTTRDEVKRQYDKQRSGAHV